MMRVTRASYALGAVAAFLVLAAVAEAQTGGVRGKVVDQAGKPVEGAQVVISAKESARKMELKTDKKGEFVQIGLFPGEYVITVTKESLKDEVSTRIGLGDPVALNFQLKQAVATDERKKQMAELQAEFDVGLGALRAGNYDAAIASYEKTIAMVPSCADCYLNLGIAYAGKKDLDKALEAQLKAVELRPTLASAWNELANLYNLKGMPDKAMEASNKAAEVATTAGTAGGGGGAAVLYNQGVILWNQNKFAEAKEKFDAAAKVDPKHAETQFMVGMAALNVSGDTKAAVAAFETYLQLAPSGPNAPKAKEFVSALKQ
jgi:tetratricopeptide (TPR) repeat protein